MPPVVRTVLLSISAKMVLSPTSKKGLNLAQESPAAKWKGLRYINHVRKKETYTISDYTIATIDIHPHFFYRM